MMGDNLEAINLAGNHGPTLWGEISRVRTSDHIVVVGEERRQHCLLF